MISGASADASQENAERQGGSAELELRVEPSSGNYDIQPNSRRAPVAGSKGVTLTHAI